MWIGAGIGAGVAVTFYLLQGPGEQAPPAEVSALHSAAVRVGPGSLQIVGQF
jgi:hypothetical protein